jgi:PAS domain S-box-containing protein
MPANIRNGICEAADLTTRRRSPTGNLRWETPYTAPELLARVRSHLNKSRWLSEIVKLKCRSNGVLGIKHKYLQEPLPIAMLRGPSHDFVFANHAYLRLLGLEDEQVLDRPVRDLLPIIDSQARDDILNRTYQTGKRFVTREQPLTVNRSGKKRVIYVQFSCLPIRNSRGQVEGILLHAIDVTEEAGARVELEKGLEQKTTAELEKARNRICKLESQLKYAREEERRRIARELHDGTGQLIAALKWKLRMLSQQDTSHDPELSKVVSNSLGLLDELSQEVRTVSHLLYPPLVDKAGLSAALHRYIDGFAERSGLAVDLQIDSNMERLPVEIEATVFRVIQEALTNIHRHARTKSAAVRLRQSPNDITVQIEDRGRGIPDFMSLSQPNFKAGIGIQSMQERIRHLNGSFDLASGRGGTIVTAILPKVAVTEAIH